MDVEFEYDLTRDQWETLKALRIPVSEPRALRRHVVDQLAALGLALIDDTAAAITPAGRRVLIRGSSKLLDLAV
jgi:hypothetical protein